MRGRPFKKGDVANPKGRTKGATNRVTGTMKEIMSAIVLEEFQSGRVVNALKRLYDKSPAQYVQVIDKMGESVLPKLARTELTGENGEPIKILKVGGIDPNGL